MPTSHNSSYYYLLEKKKAHTVCPFCSTVACSFTIQCIFFATSLYALCYCSFAKFLFAYWFAICHENNKKSNKISAGIVIILLLLLFQFKFNIIKSYLYYPNAIAFLNNQESVEAYQSFFDPHV